MNAGDGAAAGILLVLMVAGTAGLLHPRAGFSLLLALGALLFFGMLTRA